ncbi:LOW QUALITY PROTEIN: uncharacterized protein LOC141972566 [Athene noctua]|uniref:LOW QUALITY PROTEIN: uncharacterized protein LOC141972566 n=1 Tax=Athene noctua TaxID=126797 RepID=UPI003EB971F1
MLQGPQEEPQSPAVAVEHDGQQQPRDTQGSRGTGEPRKCSFKGTYAEDLQEDPTQPWSRCRGKEEYKCEQCGKVFGWQGSLIRHQRIHTGEKPFKCPDCGKSFRDSWRLLSHRRGHTEEKPFLCTTCGKRFSCSSNLIRHQLIHTGERPFTCSDCGKTFRQSDQLRRHQKTVHNGEEMYKCEDCGKFFMFRSTLTDQERIHTGEKPYKCPDCGRSFRLSWYLLSHQRTHTEEKPFPCTTCGKRFSWCSALTIHRYIHRGERLDRFLHWEMTFLRNTNLRKNQRAVHPDTTLPPSSRVITSGGIRQPFPRHQRNHPGERPHKGPDGGKTCKDFSSLISQHRAQKGERPYKCLEGGESFSHSSSLSSHRRPRTAEKPPSCSAPPAEPLWSPPGAGTAEQKEEQCQPRAEQRGMLQGPQEEPQSPAVAVEHDGQQQPRDTQGSRGTRRPRKCSFKGTYGEDPQEDTTQPPSPSREKKERKCEHCGKVFTCGTYLSSHLRTHTGEKPYKCWDCGRSFTQKGNLRRHQRTHTKEKPFICTTCGKRFSCKSDVTIHHRIHTGERPFPCSHCGKRFRVKCALRKHQESIHNGAGTAEQKEEQCQPRAEQRGMLQGPQEEPQSPAVAVEHDGQQQPRDTQGSRGTREPRKCSFKGTYSEDPQEATTQPPSISRKNEYKCEQCEKVFTWKRSLRRHRQIHTGEKPFNCQDCGKSFRQKYQLQKHQTIHTKEEPYLCTTCGKRFSFKTSLIMHQHGHTGESPNTCSGKTFETGTCGEDNQEGASQPPSSSRGKKYMCEYCGKVYPSGSELRRHQRSHTGERPYKCQDCGKSFMTSGHLLCHQKIHTREKPFPCTTCGKRFSFSSRLITHQQTHTGVRPYPCLHCGKKFVQGCNLTQHLKAVHNGDVTAEQKEEQCQPRAEQRGMLQGPQEEPQSPAVAVEHDGQQQPDDTQRSRTPRRPRKCSFKGTYAEDPPENETETQSSSTEKLYRCEHCGKFFSTSSNRTRHLRTQCVEKPFESQECGKSFTRGWKLQCHQTRHKSYLCSMCGKRFSCRSNLLKHQFTRTGERLCDGSHCGKSFQQNYQLGKHQEVLPNDTTLPPSSRVITSGGIRQPFPRLLQAPSPQLEPGQAPPVLEEELESKEEQTPPGQGEGVKNTHPATSKPVARATRGTSNCPEGGKIFRGSNSRRRHQRNHPGERPHKGPDGGKTCKDFSSLISQHRAQKGERPYKCLEGGESFSHSSSLSTHRRPRTAEKPPSCSAVGNPLLRSKHSSCTSGSPPGRCPTPARSARNREEPARGLETLLLAIRSISKLSTRGNNTPGAGTAEQKEEQCQPRAEQRGMLQGPQEEPQSPAVAVEHDGQQQPRDTQGSRGTRRPRKCSFKGTYAEDPQEATTQPQIRSGEEKVKCDQCGKLLGSKYNLTHHLRTHTGEKPYKCWDCGRSFATRQNLQRHRRTHTQEKPYLCTTCGKCFSFGSSLLVHQRIHTGERPYVCAHCGRAFMRDHHLRRHQESIHNGAGTAEQKEEQCQPRAEQRGMLQGPQEEPQSPAVAVEHDGQQQPRDTQGSRGTGEPRKCSFKGTYGEDCQEATTQPPSISRKNEYKCEQCGKVFTWKRSLRRHRLIHTGEKPFKCQDCGKRFRQRDSLRMHQRRHTKEEPYLCTTCGKRFSFKTSLIMHQHGHTGESTNTCSGKTFETGTCGEDTQDGASQPPSSSGGKKYMCEYCGKIYPSGSELRRHQRSHTGERPYKCQDCGKSFMTSGHLLGHQKIHTREKPFPCTTCGKRFSFSSRLITHQQTHTGVRPYPCLHCGKKFLQGCNLTQHLKAVHSGDVTAEQKEEQCQPRAEQRGMLQGPQEEPQSPAVAVEHDGQQQPGDTQRSHGTRRPRKCSFKGTYAEDPPEDETETQSSSTEKLYECEHCGKFFNNSSNRTRHQWTHSGEKPFKCQKCGKSFTHKWKLRCHQRTHMEEKSYLCPTCGKRFCISNLLNHQFNCTGESLCDGSHCGKSFQQNYQLGKHQEVLPNGTEPPAGARTSTPGAGGGVGEQGGADTAGTRGGREEHPPSHQQAGGPRHAGDL